MRVTPNAGRDALGGWAKDAEGRPVLHLRVAASPTGGAANTAATALLAKALGVPKTAVALRAGATSRIKRFEIDGDAGALAARLTATLGP